MKARSNKTGYFVLSLFAVTLSQTVFAEDDAQSLNEVVVTAPKMQEPLKVETNPKAPRQPVPAHDGADYLKSIPGFSVIRKGGTDGDPVLRGMAGSRLNILVDGQSILGGCNFRMDAPTAYIFPEVFDSLTVIKGPQSVLYGAGNSAGAVLFERKPVQFTESGQQIHGSVLAGSFGRHDEVLDGKFGNASAYGQVTATNSQSGDYKDGNGSPVHSAYRRYSANAAIGWTPDEDTRFELFGAYSDGHAAYADRGMDGTKFLRENAGVKLERKNVSPLFEKVEAWISQNDVDHIMDDQTLRTPGTMGYANLKRNTVDMRLAATLRVSDSTKITLGVDGQTNDHSSRSAPASGVYTAFSDDATFRQQGIFGELTHLLDDKQRIIAGYRADLWKAQDKRAAMIMNYNAMGMIANPSSGQQRSETLHSGFARYESQLDEPTTVYAGLGHSSRFPDYWELIAKQSVTTGSSFNTRSEKTNQLDAGVLYKTGDKDFTVSAFYSKVSDFILVDYSPMTKMATGAVRNVDATTYGAEVGYGQALGGQWKLNSSLAYVHGDNNTDGKPLAQLPPLEGRIGVSYDDKQWSFGALARLVASQNRFDLNKGNIVGKDLGATTGFAIFSLNAGWRPNKTTLVTAGVDNLFNRNYAEFISRAGGNGMGGAIPGYSQTTRVNEPGRMLWLKANMEL
jgi:iron complex outermembrane recepter protein